MNYLLNISVRFLTKFISHTHFCSSNREKEKLVPRSQSTTESVALTLWSKTLLNKVKDQVTVENIDEEGLVKRMRRKWFTMSDSFQTSWHQAAKVLLELSNASHTLRNQEHLFIEGEEKESQTARPVDMKRIGGVTRPQQTKHPNYHSKRDNKGRWSSKEEKRKISCDDCDAEFPNEWKLNRHKTTKKHVDQRNKRSNIPCDQIEEELDQLTSGSQGGVFGLSEHEDSITEGINEREILYESPCDIIMEDQTK